MHRRILGTIPIEKKEVMFYADGIIAVQVADGIVYISLCPICNLLDIQWSAQRRRINRDEILSQVVRLAIRMAIPSHI